MTDCNANRTINKHCFTPSTTRNELKCPYCGHCKRFYIACIDDAIISLYCTTCENLMQVNVKPIINLDIKATPLNFDVVQQLGGA